jgi:hypothetical protein
VEAKSADGAFVFDAASLSNMAPAPGFPVTPAPGPRRDQEGPRLVSISALSPNAQFSKGARLIFGPETSSTFDGKPFEVIVFARALANNPSAKIGLGVIGDGPVAWQEGPVTANFTALRFGFEASKTPPKGLAFWPSTQGEGQGIEIKSVTLRPIANVSQPESLAP